MKKWLPVTLFLTMTPSLFAAASAEAPAATEDWLQLEETALACAISMPAQSTDLQGSYFGCGPNQISRVCAANGVDYPYATAVKEACTQKFLTIHAVDNPASCIGPTCQQLARHLNRALKKIGLDGYKSFSSVALDEAQFIARIRAGISANKPVIILKKEGEALNLPVIGAVDRLHYLTIVGISADSKVLKVLDTDGAVEEKTLSTIVASMEAASTVAAAKQVIGLRSLAQSFGFTIAPSSDVTTWEAYSYACYCPDQKEGSPAAEKEGCAQQ